MTMAATAVSRQQLKIYEYLLEVVLLFVQQYSLITITITITSKDHLEQTESKHTYTIH